MMAEVIGGLCCIAIFFTGYWLGRTTARPKVDIDAVRQYMQQVVNAEEADERYNLTRKMLHDANRRTMPRANSGDPAKVYKMRTRRERPFRRTPSNS